MWSLLTYLRTDCCVSVPIERALTIFVTLYITASLVTSLIAGSNLIKCLNDDRTMCQCLLIMVAHLLNVQLFLFGHVPALHRYFRIQKLWQTVRQLAPIRNVPQTFLIVTVLGLLIMNTGHSQSLSNVIGWSVITLLSNVMQVLVLSGAD